MTFARSPVIPKTTSTSAASLAARRAGLAVVRGWSVATAIEVSLSAAGRVPRRVAVVAKLTARSDPVITPIG